MCSPSKHGMLITSFYSRTEFQFIEKRVQKCVRVFECVLYGRVQHLILTLFNRKQFSRISFNKLIYFISVNIRPALAPSFWKNWIGGTCWWTFRISSAKLIHFVSFFFIDGKRCLYSSSSGCNFLYERLRCSVTMMVVVPLPHTHTNCPFILQFFELSMSTQYSSKVREREKDEDRSRVFDIKSICWCSVYGMSHIQFESHTRKYSTRSQVCLFQRSAKTKRIKSSNGFVNRRDSMHRRDDSFCSAVHVFFSFFCLSKNSVLELFGSIEEKCHLILSKLVFCTSFP